jgi:hypothetical protein
MLESDLVSALSFLQKTLELCKSHATLMIDGGGGGGGGTAECCAPFMYGYGFHFWGELNDHSLRETQYASTQHASLRKTSSSTADDAKGNTSDSGT